MIKAKYDKLIELFIEDAPSTVDDLYELCIEEGTPIERDEIQFEMDNLVCKKMAGIREGYYFTRECITNGSRKSRS